MFKINPNPTFTAKVPLSVPGESKRATVDVEFKHLSRKAIQEFFQNLEGKTDAESLGEIIVGWKGIDAPFSAQSLETLLDNYPAAGRELFEAFRVELMEARAKN